MSKYLNRKDNIMGQIGVGKFIAQVDDEDLPAVEGLVWNVHDGAAKTKYARCRSKGKPMYMHRLIMSVLDKPDVFVDHINSDGLDNRKINLRLCTKQENLWNKRWCRKTKVSSRYKGVVVVGRPFRATITVNYKPIFLGSFCTEREAALAYNVAAVKYFGPYARLNNVD